MALVDLQGMSLKAILEPEGTLTNPIVAVDVPSNLVVVSDYSCLRAYHLQALREGDLAVAWSTREVPGVVQRAEWVNVRSTSTLVVCTAGTAAFPKPNGLYLLTSNGEVRQKYVLQTEERTQFGQPGFRALLVMDMDGDGNDEVVAVADDSSMYLWRPDWAAQTSGHDLTSPSR